MRYHADLQWVRMAFRDFSRTVVSGDLELKKEVSVERMRPVFLFFSLSEFWRTLLASIIGLLTLAGIMTCPFRWSEARLAMIGAGTLLLLGLIRPADAARTLLRDWNT